jgi:hypothetical protein
MKKNSDIIICECLNTEHQMIIHYSEDNEDFPFVYLNDHLVKQPFLKRLKNGIKHIFGYRSKYGMYDEFIFGVDDAEKFEKISNHLKGKKYE